MTERGDDQWPVTPGGDEDGVVQPPKARSRTTKVATTRVTTAKGRTTKTRTVKTQTTKGRTTKGQGRAVKGKATRGRTVKRTVRSRKVSISSGPVVVVPDDSVEQSLRAEGCQWGAGLDEVGR